MAFKSELLRAKLKEAGKTRRFLAELTDVKERTVSRWLNDKNPPKSSDLEKIAEALGCAPQDFDPSFVDEGQGEVAIHARVSVAAHNGYEMMRLRYGVSQKDIMELAPTLFAIVAGHALRVTEQDESLAREAERLGLRPEGLIGSSERANGFEIDEKACKDKKCFGLRAKNPSQAAPRNLFYEAILRLCHNIQSDVSAEYLVKPAPGEVPPATGFIADLDWLIKWTGGDNALAEALVMGRVRLSKCIETHKKGEDQSVEAFIRVLRLELLAADEKYNDQIAMKRAESLAKLKAWRAFYEKRHPDLAREYDRIVEKHCHKDGWASPYFDDETNENSWADPYREIRDINEETLPEYQKKKAESPGMFHFHMTDPIYQRFEQLERLRRKSKAQFEEGGK